MDISRALKRVIPMGFIMGILGGKNQVFCW